ncbi:unannotated protein [freshwater metagenome]|uniref:Unannotated protein n=1 Tax=freshwater metagenome TaxID=449393 RepID=A0A6J6XTX1_9ZZZZ
MLPWLVPMPSKNRSGNASVNVFCPACIVAALRACIDAIPVPTMSFFVAPSNKPACANGSRPTASGIHTVENPSDSISFTASSDLAIGCASSVHVHRPSRPISSGFVIDATITAFSTTARTHVFYHETKFQQNKKDVWSNCSIRFTHRARILFKFVTTTATTRQTIRSRENCTRD